MKPFTAKQEVFLRALASGQGPSQAYRIAYSVPPHVKRQSVAQAAQRVMKLPHMAPHVASIRLRAVETADAETARTAAERTARHKALLEELDISRERVLRELARVAFADMRNLASWEGDGALQYRGSAELGEAESAAIAELVPTARGVRLKLHDKLAALSVLGRMLGLFEVEKAEPDNALHLSINIVPPEGEERDRLEAAQLLS